MKSFEQAQKGTAAKAGRRAAVAVLGAGICLVLTVLPGAAAGQESTPEPAAIRRAVRLTLEELNTKQSALSRAYEPFRRRVAADPAVWQGLDALYAAVGEVADCTDLLRGHVERLRSLPSFGPAIGRVEFRQRLSAVDSLAAATRVLAATNWRQLLPDDQAEAPLRVKALASQARSVADKTALAAASVAYAVDVTEGINARAISLTVVGILVVFAVLTLIASAVGSIRRLDDGWQQQEELRSRQSVHKEPTIDATTVVLIAAACATVITGRHRVRRIRRLLSPATKRTPWSAQGRLILQGSHDFGRKHV
ncbi:MAG: hypothetical protein RBT60_09710 [Candidatus Krumholzibacteria bacterium]|jgi:Na+-transporting methylmalonyl-CoA/oxaloacetate decarboxylase gamma subunit|nr:hypothetical protein [Candidatus Krumholzibacteria bacterium]